MKHFTGPEFHMKVTSITAELPHGSKPRLGSSLVSSDGGTQPDASIFVVLELSKCL